MSKVGCSIFLIFVIAVLITFITMTTIAVRNLDLAPYVEAVDKFGEKIVTISEELEGYKLDDKKSYEIVKNNNELVLLVHFVNEEANDF